MQVENLFVDIPSGSPKLDVRFLLLVHSRVLNLTAQLCHKAEIAGCQFVLLL